MRIRALTPAGEARFTWGMAITTSYYDGEAIRVVRCLRGWSRKALAERSGLRDTRLTSIELGAAPRAEELAQIWGALTCESTSSSKAKGGAERV